MSVQFLSQSHHTDMLHSQLQQRLFSKILDTACPTQEAAAWVSELDDGMLHLTAHEVKQSYALCRFPWLMRTDIPPLLQYPVKAGAFDFVCGLVKMFYGLTLRDQLQGIFSIVRALLKREPAS